jgi:hypothetical protein
MSALSTETLNLLKSVLDETWDSLRPEEKARTNRIEIGKRILEVVEMGERDPIRLRIRAVAGVVTSPL